jgi:hypothetical protein
MTEDEDTMTDANAPAKAGEMHEDEIDRNLDESFPASDPPSWTLGSNHRTDSKPEDEDEGDVRKREYGISELRKPVPEAVAAL